MAANLTTEDADQGATVPETEGVGAGGGSEAEQPSARFMRHPRPIPFAPGREAILRLAMPTQSPMDATLTVDGMHMGFIQRLDLHLDANRRTSKLEIHGMALDEQGSWQSYVARGFVAATADLRFLPTTVTADRERVLAATAETEAAAEEAATDLFAPLAAEPVDA
jgi:hypothetical protein